MVTTRSTEFVTPWDRAMFEHIARVVHAAVMRRHIISHWQRYLGFVMSGFVIGAFVPPILCDGLQHAPVARWLFCAVFLVAVLGQNFVIAHVHAAQELLALGDTILDPDGPFHRTIWQAADDCLVAIGRVRVGVSAEVGRVTFGTKSTDISENSNAMCIAFVALCNGDPTGWKGLEFAIERLTKQIAKRPYHSVLF